MSWGRAGAVWEGNRRCFGTQETLGFQENVKSIPALRETHGKNGRSNSRLRAGITHVPENQEFLASLQMRRFPSHTAPARPQLISSHLIVSPQMLKSMGIGFSYF